MNVLEILGAGHVFRRTRKANPSCAKTLRKGLFAGILVRQFFIVGQHSGVAARRVGHKFIPLKRRETGSLARLIELFKDFLLRGRIRGPSLRSAEKEEEDCNRTEHTLHCRQF